MTTAEEPLTGLLPPEQPTVRLPPRQWVQHNLFSSWPNTMLTALFGGLLAWAGTRAVRFVFVTAEWEILRRNITSFMVGRFPRDELWRTWVAMYLLAALLGLVAAVVARLGAEAAAAKGGVDERSWTDLARRFWPVGLLALVVLGLSHGALPVALVAGLAAALVAGQVGGRLLPRSKVRFVWVAVAVGLLIAWQVMVAFDGVPTARWGGLLLTAYVTVVGIAVAFPIGLLLALGRRSSLPAVRATSVAYIEFFRGVPLITLLFMAAFVIGFLFPQGMRPPSVLVRALIAIVVFEAAYVAEVVRGGLHAVPRGQFEAAQAMGLSPWKTMRRVVLPQALRAVLPAMVGQFISLYKDTSLLTIVSITELLRVAQTVTQQPDFLGQGLHAETLAFAGFIYWVGSYTMSRESQRIERRLGVGER
jgi:general L-amino acid transport system permease protein